MEHLYVEVWSDEEHANDAIISFFTVLEDFGHHKMGCDDGKYGFYRVHVPVALVDEVKLTLESKYLFTVPLSAVREFYEYTSLPGSKW